MENKWVLLSERCEWGSVYYVIADENNRRVELRARDCFMIKFPDGYETEVVIRSRTTTIKVEELDHSYTADQTHFGFTWYTYGVLAWIPITEVLVDRRQTL